MKNNSDSWLIKKRMYSDLGNVKELRIKFGGIAK